MEGVWSGVGGGEEGDYIPVTTTMTPALIKMGSDESRFNNYFINCEGQSHKAVSTDTTFEEKGELKWIRNEVPLLLIKYYR